MKRKLTISISQEIIEMARRYAKLNNTSLSKIVESYLQLLTSELETKRHIRTTPLVDSLCGIIELPDDFDYRKERRPIS
ncbi:MAG: DUF6364 family protein [Saprospiraceae bacterium]|nr:DUF6364 family protein [Saprospiraceae bacterium]